DHRLAVLFRTKARHRLGVQLLGRDVAACRRRRRLRRGRGRRRHAECGHLLIGLVERRAQRSQGLVLLLEGALQLLALLRGGLRLSHQERALGVERLELAGQAGDLLARLLLTFPQLLDLLDERGHLGLPARLLRRAAAGCRHREHAEPGQDDGAGRHGPDRTTSILEKSIFPSLEVPFGFSLAWASRWTICPGCCSSRRCPSVSSSATSSSAADSA